MTSERGSDHPTAGGGLVTVVETDHEFEAQAIAAVLKDAGIEAFVFPFAILPSSGPLGPFVRVPVQVAADQLDAAKAVLAANRVEGPEVDWDEVDVGQPEPDPGARIDPLARRVGQVLTPARLGWAILVVLILLPGLLLLVVRLLPR